MDLEINLKSEREEVIRATQFTLIGKMLTGRNLNKKGVMGVLKNVWSVQEVVEIREMSGNLYAISFADKLSMETALEEGPWSVMGCCLNLKRWEVDQAIQEVSFSKVTFWIQIHKLPLELLTEQNARKIGSVLGELVSVEDPMNNRGVGRSFLRIRVKVDVEKPLVGGFWVFRENKEKVWVEVKYEKITDFYCGYGRLGHVVRFCENKGEMGEEIEGRRRYGLRMKAAPKKEGGREDGREKKIKIQKNGKKEW